MGSRRNFQREKKLQQEWSYYKPYGPHYGDDPESTIKNLNEMDPADVQRLIEIADEMAEYISNL